MHIASLPAGHYVVAVSGGLDSVVLLHMLAARSDCTLVVAHFDHGIRPDSSDDAAFVRGLAEQYGVAYQGGHAHLGPRASEEIARKARYAFLRKVARVYNAALLTAHHQDDLLETVAINMLRGTGWRGLCSLRDTTDIRRPLLAVSKKELLVYALKHKLEWHQDSTNHSWRYLRNRLRRVLTHGLNEASRHRLLALAAAQVKLRQAIEQTAGHLLEQTADTTLRRDTILPRTWLTCLPPAVQAEIVGQASVVGGAQRPPRPQQKRARWFIATARPAKIMQLGSRVALIAQKSKIVVRVGAI